MSLILLVVLGHILLTKETVTTTVNPPIEVNDAQAKLDEELLFWQKVLELQPTSRDILNNISLIYQSKNNIKLAKKYQEAALLVDPNPVKPNNLK